MPLIWKNKNTVGRVELALARGLPGRKSEFSLYTQNTEEVTVWCKREGRFTQHKVMNGRVCHCLECPPRTSKTQEKRFAKQKRERENPTLFGGGK